MERPLNKQRLLVGLTCVVCLISGAAVAQVLNPPDFVLRQGSKPKTGLPSAREKSGKVAGDLQSLYSEYRQHLIRYKSEVGPIPVFRSDNPMMPVKDDLVTVDLVASGRSEDLVADLKKIGAIDIQFYGRMVSARIPITAIDALNGLASLKSVMPAYVEKRSGSVTSQGDAAMNADNVRQMFRVNGRGVVVGTLSDSYDCLNGAAAGVASGDLPRGVRVLRESSCPDSDEGRGMMEIIHDIAPGATQIFHTANGGQASFAQGIVNTANAGATVINDDIGYLTEPFFQDGVIAQAVDSVNDNGVAYFSAVGNDGRNSYQSTFRRSGVFQDYGFGSAEAHDFDPTFRVDTCQAVTIPVGGSVSMSFQWDQPYFSVSGAPGSSSDIDILLLNGACDTILASGVAGNVGSDPIEILSYTNPGPSTSFNLMIFNFSGPPPGLMKTLMAGRLRLAEYSTSSSTAYGHVNTNKVMAVGAAFYDSTPRFGVNPPVIESFSSRGGTPKLFDVAGRRLPAPQVPRQPGIVAPDGVDTSFFGRDTDSNGFPNFSGTSAAAPHAAGVAALIKSFRPSLTPQQIYSAMQSTAIDMGTSGFDFVSGFGLIDALAAISSVGQAPPGPSSTCGQSFDLCKGSWRVILQ